MICNFLIPSCSSSMWINVHFDKHDMFQRLEGDGGGHNHFTDSLVGRWQTKSWESML